MEYNTQLVRTIITNNKNIFETIQKIEELNMIETFQ